MKRFGMVVGLLIASAAAAQAQSIVTSRATLGATGFFDWSVLGPANTDVANPTSGIAGTTTGGITATVSKEVAGPLRRVDQGAGWGGNFAGGDALLWTVSESGFMRIAFSGAVDGVGAQIQRNFFGSFTATLRVFNGATLLDTFTLDGNSTSGANNSAIFLGAQGAPITAIEYQSSADQNGNAGFAINRLSIRTTTIPEPSTYALMATGLVALVGVARRRRTA
jgi:hypothetical protein